MRGMVGTDLAAGILCVVLAVPRAAQTSPALSEAEIRELITAAKATSEAVDYARVTPDILTQILAKLDKLDNKLDRVENAVEAQQGRRAR